MRAKSQASVAVRQFLRTSSDHGGLAGCRLDVFHRLGSFLRLLFVKFYKQAHGLHIEITKSQGDTTPVSLPRCTLLLGYLHFAHCSRGHHFLYYGIAMAQTWHMHGICMAYTVHFNILYRSWDLRLSICPNLNYQVSVSSWKLSKVISPFREHEYRPC